MRPEAEAKAAAQAKIEALKTPKCQDALKHANAVVNDLRFTPTAEQAEVEQAQRRLANLKRNPADPKGYWQAVRPYLEKTGRADSSRCRAQAARGGDARGPGGADSTERPNPARVAQEWRAK